MAWEPIEQFATTKGPQCGVARILKRVSKDEQALIKEYLASPDWASTTIARWLTANGHPIRDPSVARHRRRTCGCDA